MSAFSLLAVDPAQTHHWLLPENAEIIYGGIASIIIIGSLVKFAGPMAKKAFAARTERIQKELDASANDLASAQSDAANIRKALGDIDSERARLLADARSQADAILAEGRSRVTSEVAELEAKAEADMAAAASRGSDELRAEIARVSSVAVDAVVPSVLDASAQQNLVENFISKVGASR